MTAHHQFVEMMAVLIQESGAVESEYNFVNDNSKTMWQKAASAAIEAG